MKNTLETARDFFDGDNRKAWVGFSELQEDTLYISKDELARLLFNYANHINKFENQLMMKLSRKHLFRGKRIDNKQWVFGSLIVDSDIPEGSSCRIVTHTGPYEWVEVDPATVSRFINVKGFESNHEHKQPGDPEVELFEDDIVEAHSQGSRGRFVIKFRNGGCPIWLLYPAWQMGKTWAIAASDLGREPGDFYDGLRRIGNVHDNPDLVPVLDEIRKAKYEQEGENN